MDEKRKTLKIAPITPIPDYVNLKNEEHDFEIQDTLWDGYSIGKAVGRVRKDGTHESFIKEDKDANNNEAFDKLLREYPLHKKEFQLVVNGNVESVSYYFILYKIVGRSLDKQTFSEEFVQGASNVSYEVTYEVMLTAGNGLIKYIVPSYKTSGSGSMSFFEVVKNLEDTFEEYFSDCLNGFSHEDNCFMVYFYDAVGEKYPVEVYSVNELLSMVTSMRVLKIETKIN